MHCVITGFDRETSPAPQLFSYANPKADPVPHTVGHINGYLVEGPNILVGKRMKPVSVDLPLFRFGSKPVDGGNLILSDAERISLENDAVVMKYLRRFIMGKELLHDIPRWCLWMVDLDHNDLRKSEELRRRLDSVREMRSSSTKVATQKIAHSPYLFGENHQPDSHYLGMPAVFSGTRLFATCAWLPPEVIAGNKIYTCDDPDGFAFAIASSSMFITWQKAIGGRLKSDYNFSNTVVWNNLPLPPVSKELREQIISAGQGVLAARELHPERSLAEHYNPLAMDPALLKAHAALDRVVDRAFGAASTCKNNEERLQLLFTRYAELTAGE